MAAKGMRWLALGCALVGGCVERHIDVTSNPPGALVTMNDQEVGRTPFTKQFTWYGTFEVQVRKEGYQTLKTDTPVIAPWWQWMPFDLLAELLPLRLEDHHEIAYTLKPFNDEHADPEALVRRAQGLRERLEDTSTATSTPPATRPSVPKRKATPASQPK